MVMDAMNQPEETRPLVMQPDGVRCRYCGESSETLAAGSAEYIGFWDAHEKRSHKLEHIRANVGHYPTDDALAAVLDVLVEG